MELVLVKEERAASFGVLRESAERGEYLGLQPGGVGLFSGMSVLADLCRGPTYVSAPRNKSRFARRVAASVVSLKRGGVRG